MDGAKPICFLPFLFFPCCPHQGPFLLMYWHKNSFFSGFTCNTVGPNLTDNCKLHLDYMENCGSPNNCSIGKSTKAAALLKKHCYSLSCFISECRQGGFAETLSIVSY